MRVRVRQFTAALLVASLALGACGGDDTGQSSSTDDDGPASTDAPTETATDGTSDDGPDDGDGAGTTTTAPSAGNDDPPETESPARVDVLRYGAPIGLITFDPHQVPNGPQLPFLTAVYDSLIGREADGTLVPRLAETWGYLDDGTTFELVLRDDVTFADGAAFDADAVVANLERLRELAGANAPFGAQIAAVSAVDPTTVHIELNAFSPTIANDLSLVVGMVISPDALDAPDLDRNPVGTGPYRYVAEDSIEGELRVFELNPDYWDPTAQPADRIEIREILDAAARLNALEAGEIDFTTILSPQVQQAEAVGLSVVGQTDLYWSLTVLDREGTLVPEFGDVRVRHALAHAIDQEAIVDAVFFGQGAASDQPYPAGRLGHADGLDEVFPYDAERARELLAEAGAEGLAFDAPALPFMVPYMEALQAFFRDVGVEMTIDVLQPGTLATAALEGRYPMWTSALAIADPHEYFAQIYSDGAAFNVFGFSTPELQVAGEAGAAIADRTSEEARAAYAEYSRVLVEEGIVINVAHASTPIAHGATIESMDAFDSAAFPGYRIFQFPS